MKIQMASKGDSEVFDHFWPKPKDDEIIAAMMEWHSGRNAVTYIIRNTLGRKRCTTPWLLRQLKRMEKDGRVVRSPQQRWGGMISWDVNPQWGREVEEEGEME